MRKQIVFLGLLFLASCASGGHVTTMNSFQEVPLGASSTELVETLGEPAEIVRKKDGSLHYEYIERIKTGGRNSEQRRYIFVVKEGKVVSKEVKQSSPASYGFDSYEMQTTGL